VGCLRRYVILGCLCFPGSKSIFLLTCVDLMKHLVVLKIIILLLKCFFGQPSQRYASQSLDSPPSAMPVSTLYPEPHEPTTSLLQSL